MGTSKEAKTPVLTTTELARDEKGKYVDPTHYRSIIESLLCLMEKKSYIIFSMELCAHFQVDSKESHLLAAKRIIKYIKRIVDFSILFGKDILSKLIAFSDVDCVGKNLCRKESSIMVQQETKFNFSLHR